MKCTIFVLLAFLTMALCQSMTSWNAIQGRQLLDGSLDNNWPSANNNQLIGIYKAKVVGRLLASRTLANQEEVKNKLYDIAMKKLDACETNLPQSANQSINSCLGSATGQIMTLISSYEANQAIQMRSSMNSDTLNKDN